MLRRHSHVEVSREVVGAHCRVGCCRVACGGPGPAGLTRAGNTERPRGVHDLWPDVCDLWPDVNNAWLHTREALALGSLSVSLEKLPVNM